MYTESTTEQKLCNDINYRGGTILYYLIKPNGWQKGSNIYNSLYTEERTISINYCVTTAETYVDGIGIIDLTATFGVGNEPNKTWCDNYINYFEETTTVTRDGME